MGLRVASVAGKVKVSDGPVAAHAATICCLKPTSAPICSPQEATALFTFRVSSQSDRERGSLTLRINCLSQD